jgi:hypothetical protein
MPKKGEPGYQTQTGINIGAPIETQLVYSTPAAPSSSGVYVARETAPSAGASSGGSIIGVGGGITAYTYGKETYYVDPFKSGGIYDANGNLAFKYDYNTGQVTDISGKPLGTLNRATGAFTDNSGRTATPTSASYVPIDLGAALNSVSAPKKYAGQYNFQNGSSFSVDNNGNITDLSSGKVIGRVDDIGRVYSTSGSLLGTLSTNKFGDATFRDLSGNVATTYPTTGGSASGFGGVSNPAPAGGGVYNPAPAGGGVYNPAPAGGGVYNPAPAGGGFSPSPARDQSGPASPGRNTESSGFDEQQYINDFLHGLLKETTQQFFNARDVINQQLAPFINSAFQRQQGILDELNYLSHETFNILDPIRKALQQDVATYASGLSSLQNTLTNIASSLQGLTNRLGGGLNSLGNVTNRNERVASQVETNLLNVLRGNITLPSFMQQDLERAKSELEDRLRRNLGPGYETSTPGIDALMQLERLRSGVIDEFRQLELQRLGSLLGQSDTSLINAAQVGGGLGSVLGNLLSASANISSQAAQTPLQAAAARSGLVNDISNIANLGFNMAGGLLQQTAQTAGLPLMLTSAQQGLAANAVDVLGRAALLPAQARATYLGLLFSALQPATSTPVNPANVLASLTTQTANAANAGYNLASLASNLYQANQLGSYVRGSGLSEALSNILGGLGRTIPQTAGR